MAVFLLNAIDHPSFFFTMPTDDAHGLINVVINPISNIRWTSQTQFSLLVKGRRRGF